MDRGTFFERVYEVARRIPAGRVTSYGAITEYLGMKGSSRMVGYAMAACGAAYPPVPAHRIVNRNGLLTGKFHFPAPDLMVQMLESEGVRVEQDKVVDFKRLFWHPAENEI